MSERGIDPKEPLLPPVKVTIGSTSLAEERQATLVIELGDNPASIVLYDQPEAGTWIYYDADSGDLIGISVEDPQNKTDFYGNLLGSNFLAGLQAAGGETFVHQIPPEEQPAVATARQQQFEALQLRHLEAPTYGITAGKVFGGSATAAF